MTVIDLAYATDTTMIRPVPRSRVDVENEIKKTERTLVDLKSDLNTFTTVCSLPAELLAEILVYRVMDEWDPSSTCYSGHLRWIRLTHVCRRFRTIALNTPRFWNHLPLTTSETFAQLVVRSKRAPLHVSACVRPTRIVAAEVKLALDVLLRHSHRLKVLRIDGSVKVVQAFCAKTVFPLDALETLKLSCEGGERMRPRNIPGPPPAAVPIIAHSASPLLRLRHLELRQVPFRWNDPVLSSPALTTLVLVGTSNRGTSGARMPDTGTLDELFSTLGAVAHCLQHLKITGALPRQGLATTTDPIRLPPVSRTIPFPSLKKICLTGDALYVAHLLNHLATPSESKLEIMVQDVLGSNVLMQSITAHMREKAPLRRVHITAAAYDCLMGLDGWAEVVPHTSGRRGAPAAIMIDFFACSSSELRLGPALRHSRTLLAHVEVLCLPGHCMKRRWGTVLAFFPSVRNLVVDGHPEGDFFSALMASRPGPHLSPPLPALRALHITDFRCRISRSGAEPFYDLLDWAIFRCNCGLPVDVVRLVECRHATDELMEKLEEVVVDVRWDAASEGTLSTCEEDDSNAEYD